MPVKDHHLLSLLRQHHDVLDGLKGSVGVQRAAEREELARLRRQINAYLESAAERDSASPNGPTTG
jgi:hypothetical protein